MQNYSKIRLEQYQEAVKTGKVVDSPLTWHIWKRNFDKQNNYGKN